MLVREASKWASAVRKAERVRVLHPGQVIDVIHADFHRHPMKVLERIYAFIGMEITDDLRLGFEQRIKEKPELSRGQHRYSISDYGMTQAQAREPFKDYVRQYDLVRER
jgi:hypothetical protein